MLLAAALTLAVQLPALLWAGRLLPPADAAMLTVMAAMAWAFLAAPVFAASAASPIGGLLRGSAVVDATLLAMIVLAATNPAISPAGPVLAYLLTCAVGLTECIVAVGPRQARRRHLAAAAAALVVLTVCAGPFWASGLLTRLPRPWPGRAAYAVVAANPVYAATGLLARSTGRVWAEYNIHYARSALVRDVPAPSVPWHHTLVIYSVLSAAAGVVSAAARRRGRATPVDSG